MKITGHTDQTDTEDYNMKLSRERALSVRDYLYAKGISKNRLVVSWKGESMPIVPGSESTREPRNRRVSFIVVKE